MATAGPRLHCPRHLHGVTSMPLIPAVDCCRAASIRSAPNFLHDFPWQTDIVATCGAVGGGGGGGGEAVLAALLKKEFSASSLSLSLSLLLLLLLLLLLN